MFLYRLFQSFINAYKHPARQRSKVLCVYLLETTMPSSSSAFSVICTLSFLLVLVPRCSEGFTPRFRSFVRPQVQSLEIHFNLSRNLLTTEIFALIWVLSCLNSQNLCYVYSKARIRLTFVRSVIRLTPQTGALSVFLTKLKITSR